MKKWWRYIGAFSFATLTACTIPVVVVSCAQTKPDVDNTQYQVQVRNLDQRFEANQQYTISAVLTPNNKSACYEWTCSNNNLLLVNVNTKELTFSSSTASSYLVLLNIYDDDTKSKKIIDNHQLEILINPANNNGSSTIAPEGGIINNLNVSAYKSVIEHLNLTSQTDISKLDNQTLNEALNSHQIYRNLSLAIEDGSNEKTGILKLRLISNDNNHPINDSIEITGFNPIKLANHFEGGNISLNWEQYFNNHQPIKETSNLTFSNSLSIRSQLIDYANTTFFFNGTKYTLEQLLSILAINEININPIDNKSNLRFLFKFKTDYKQYANNQWVSLPDAEQEILEQATNNVMKIKYPSLTDLIQFMGKKIQFNESETSKYYASYFVGRIEYSKKLPGLPILGFNTIINDQAILDQYKSIYFPNEQIYLKIDNANNYYANDFEHKLKIGFYLLNENNENDKTNYFTIESTAFKPINDYLNQALSEINRIVINPTYTEPEPNGQYINENIIFKRIRKLFKKEIDNLFLSQNDLEMIELNGVDFNNFLKTNFEIIANSTTQISNEKIQKILNSFSFAILNQSFLNSNNFGYLEGNINTGSATFDYDTSLFTPDGSIQKAFMIDSISFDFSNPNSLKLKAFRQPTNPNLVTVSFESQMQLVISNETKIQKTEFTLTITKTTWNNIRD